MDKDIDKIPKNADTDIVIRIDDFGGKRGVTIREFVRGERYTGFTKAGTRIPVDKFKAFKDAINSISEKDLMEGLESLGASTSPAVGLTTGGVVGISGTSGGATSGAKMDKGFKGKGAKGAKPVKEVSDDFGEIGEGEI